MTAADSQIITLYKQGLSPEAIAEALEYPIEGVKLVVNQNLPATAEKRGDDISDEEFEEAKRTILEVMRMSGDNKFLQLAAAKFIFNEKKGRHDVKAGQLPKISINVFNAQIRAAKEATSKVIDV